MKTPEPESADYERVERWLRRSHRCFASAVNCGTSLGRADVIGLHEIDGAPVGDVEIVAIEVKRKSSFLASCGQAAAYAAFADRVALATRTAEDFSPDAIEIATRLGVGLIRIDRGRCKQVLPAPVHSPIPRLKNP